MIRLFLFSLLVPALIIFVWEKVLVTFSKDGGRFYRISGLVGTPVHELAHAIGCLLFGLRITGIRLFNLSKNDEPMGYVRFLYNPGRLRHQIGCLVQGVAPLIASGLLVTYFLNITVPQAPSYITFSSMFGWFYSSATGSIANLFLLASEGWLQAALSLLLVSVALHGIPSVADIKISLAPLALLVLGGAALIAVAHALLGWDLHAMDSWPIVAGALYQLKGFFWWLLAASGAVVALAMVGGVVFLIVPALITRFLTLAYAVRAGAKT